MDVLRSTEEALVEDRSPENIFMQLNLLGSQETECEVTQYLLLHQMQSLVYMLRGAVLKEITATRVSKTRLTELLELLNGSFSKTVYGHDRIISKLSDHIGKM